MGDKRSITERMPYITLSMRGDRLELFGQVNTTDELDALVEALAVLRPFIATPVTEEPSQ